MKLTPSSNKPIPMSDEFGNASTIIVTCDTLNFSIDYAFYFREFKTRDSAIAFFKRGDTTVNITKLRLDSIPISKDTTTSK